MPSVGSSCAPVFSGNNNRIVSSEEVIPMYSVDQLRYTIVSESDDQSMLNIKILFRRKYDSYLLTIFLPCVVLYILGVLTMTSFHLDNFKDRMNVTLSLLIVVASLFSQVVSTLPASPTPKCLEWFFLIIITKLAFIFMLHTVVEHLIQRWRDNTELNSQDGKNDSKHNLMEWSENGLQRTDPDFIPRQAVIANRLGIVTSVGMAAVCTVLLVVSVIKERTGFEYDFNKATASLDASAYHNLLV